MSNGATAGAAPAEIANRLERIDFLKQAITFHETNMRAYSERLSSLAIEPELTAEALKLSYIRAVKALRFKSALIATLIAYLAIVAEFFVVDLCAF